MTISVEEYEMVEVSKGKYQIGSFYVEEPEIEDVVSEEAAENQKKKNKQPPKQLTLRTIELTNDYLIGKYPVTQELWEKVMGKNLSQFKGAKHPVEKVSWFDCVIFCNKLSEAMGLEPVYNIPKNIEDLMKKRTKTQELFDTSRLITQNLEATGFRLPTEAEWEVAAKALPPGEDVFNEETGKTEFRIHGEEPPLILYAGSNNPKDVAWFAEENESGTSEVGKKKPNSWGIYDMSGNVFEWCWDIYDITLDVENYVALKTDPIDNGSDHERSRRGGSWMLRKEASQVFERFYMEPNYKDCDLGLRLVRKA